MLYFLLKNSVRFPLLGVILNTAYYTCIGAGLAVAATLICRRLQALGYRRPKVIIFMALCVALAIPAAFISSRAANMFYYPPADWTIRLFVSAFASARNETFHAALLLPVLAISILIFAMGFSFGRVWDVIFLYVPLGHAFGRVGCFLAGCCWGNPVSICIGNVCYAFANPVPLYAIACNLMIFFWLRRRYNRIHDPARPGGPAGTIATHYLVLYGSVRFFMEYIRKEPIVGLGLTQAQWFMTGYVLAGSLFYIVIRVRYRARLLHNATSNA
ncbi:MAG: prolipoprotein diacylglyceryl transferase [Deltaproteobacteria bacterium]|nr:prolipoprotein diacylglyceryl transferase [Deltaproteobacteria bacterium]